MNKSILIGISTIVALLFCSMLGFQEDKTEIELVKKVKTLNKKSYVVYSESTWGHYEGLPKYKNGYGKLISIEFISEDDLKEIIKNELSEQEFSKLSQQRWMISIICTSDGEIVSVEFVLQDDSSIYIEHLANMAARLKKEIKLNLEFSNEILEKGYFMQSIFVSELFKEKKCKKSEQADF